jgi:hypothetical protein
MAIKARLESREADCSSAEDFANLAAEAVSDDLGDSDWGTRLPDKAAEAADG